MTNNICKICLGYLLDHPELTGWLKCNNCGFCKKSEKSMLTIQELNPKNFPLTPEQEANLLILHEKINKIRLAWGKPMIVTSGFRSMEDHLRIYKELAVKRHQTYDESKVPMASKHLYGKAVDISDPDGSLYQWCQDNVKVLEDVGLWLEIKDDQHRVHFQTEAPKSGSRFFHP